MLLHTEAFTHSTQKLCRHRKNRNFTSVFGDRTSFRAKGLQREPGNRNFTAVFGDGPSFRAKALRRTILPQFLAIEPHFVRKGCAGRLEIAILPQFLAIEPHFVRKGCAGRIELALLPQFLTIEPRFVRKGCAEHLEIALLPQFLAIEPRFVRKGRAGRLGNRNFISVFGDRTSFRAKGLRFVPSRWHCPRPRLQKRNRKEGESKRARGQEEKM